jgi:hypothetical protein
MIFQIDMGRVEWVGVTTGSEARHADETFWPYGARSGLGVAAGEIINS